MDIVSVRAGGPPKSPGSVLPKTPEDRASTLLDLMTRLTGLLTRETEALVNYRPAAEVAAIVKEKQPVTLVFEEVARLLRIDREGMAKLPAETKARLREANVRLAHAAAANGEAVRLRSGSQQVVVDTVVAAVNQARRTEPGVAYGPATHGPAARGYGPPKHGPGAAVTLNTRL